MEQQPNDNELQTMKNFNIDYFTLAVIKAKVKQKMERDGFAGQIAFNALMQDALDDHWAQNQNKPKEPTDELGSSLFKMMTAMTEVHTHQLKAGQ